jgi:AraC-like DNA-binding protein
VRNLIQSREKLIRRYIAGQADSTELVSNTHDAKFMARIDAIIKKNYAKESFSVNELMTDAGVSRTQFYLKLKSLVGMSGTEYINHFRLNESLSLLKAGYRVSEAAYATGFSSPNYFTRLFRKKFGFSPKAYIEKSSQQSSATTKA